MSKNINIQNRFEYIDALRGVAILAVLFNHVHESTEPVFSLQLPTWLNMIQAQGARGVQLFYIISAFTIFLTYSKRVTIEKTPVINFFIRRFFRIAPLFYICLIIYSLRMILFDGFGDLTLGKFISAITFTNSFHYNWINGIIPGSWSVAIEVVFYMLIPFLFFLISDIRKAFIFIAIALIFSKRFSLLLVKLGWIDITQPLQEGYIFLYLPTQLPFFILGIILYFLIYQKDFSFKNEIEKQRYIYAFFILFAFFFISFCIDGYNFYLPFYFYYGLLFFILCYLLKVYPIKIIVNKFFIHFGKISFSVYLIHYLFYPIMQFIVIQLSKLHINNPYSIFIILFLTFLILSTIFGTLSYHIIEKPFIKIGNAIIAKREKKSVNV